MSQFLISSKYRLSLDGSTKATLNCFMLKYTDVSWTGPDDVDEAIENKKKKKRPAPTKSEVLKDAYIRQTMFDAVIKSVDRCFRRGAFNKTWILIPLNLGNFHWVFVALMNAAYLGTPQDEKLTGYFLFDSISPQQTREEDMVILHNKGVLNIIVYANLVYGHPRLTAHNIRDMLFDSTKFAKLGIPYNDTVKQDDAWNCGLFVWMNMLEFSLVHSHRYGSVKDFDIIEKPSSTGSDYLLKVGDFLKLFKDNDATTPSKVLPEQIFKTIRTQGICLFNRILTLKNSTDSFSPRFPNTTFPKYVRKNFRKFVWGIDDTDQPAIDQYTSWFTSAYAEDLAKLLRCNNLVITNTEDMFVDDNDMLGDSTSNKKASTVKFTVEQLAEAGMTEVVTILDTDDEVSREHEKSIPEPTKKLAKTVQSKLQLPTRLLRLRMGKSGLPAAAVQVSKEATFFKWKCIAYFFVTEPATNSYAGCG